VEFDISEIYRSTNSAAVSSVVHRHSQSQQKNGLQAVGDIVEKPNSTISGNYWFFYWSLQDKTAVLKQDLSVILLLGNSAVTELHFRENFELWQAITSF